MKKIIQILVLAFTIVNGQLSIVNAQAPAAIPYQAVARNNSGNLIINQNIALRFSIHDGTATGTIVYQETKSTTTNAHGLFSVNIGQGTVVIGTFAGINWTTGAKFTQVEIDVTGGSTYVDIGTQQMLSVPFALYAATSGSGGSPWTTNLNDIYNSNTGKVGIGTTTPEFKLSLDNDGGIMSKGTFGTGATLTTSGAGTRMIWYPKKGAFRVGTSAGTEWDDANIGNLSIAFGNGTKASGYLSAAMGNGTIASGNTSTAMGNSTIASGGFSTAMGNHTEASFDVSTAMGRYTIASGAASTAMGEYTTASGYASTAIGSHVSTNAKDGAFALGDAITFSIMNSSADNEFSARFAGGYRFFSDAGITTANGLFFKDGKAGIGTSNPSQKLEVIGTTKTDNLQVVNGAGTGKVLISDASGNATWQTSGIASETDPQVSSSINNQVPKWNGSTLTDGIITDDGTSVGIGTSIPNAPLQFANSNQKRKIVLFETANNDNQFYGFGVNGGELRYQTGVLTDDHVFYAGASSVVSNELMRIEGNGNVGIGTASPSGKLHVFGGNAYLWGLNLGFGTSNAIITTDAAKPIIFQQAGSEKMRLDANGNLGIGTATPSGKLHIKGNANASQLIIDANATQLNTQPLIRLRNSSGSDLMYIHSDDETNAFVGLNAGRVNNASGGGHNNSFFGAGAGYTNTTGSDNTANGFQSLFFNTSGHSNTAYGENALSLNSVGYKNTAIGMYALNSNNNGNNNTATGYYSLSANTGYSNTATGAYALKANSSAYGNTALGDSADYNITSGSCNTALGYLTGVVSGTLTNTTAIGYNAIVYSDNMIMLGNSSVSYVETWGGYFFASDGRFKNNISEDVKGLSFIKLLRPVIYNFDVKKCEEYSMQNFDDNQKVAHMKGREEGMAKATAIRQSGFIAQEVLEAAKKSGYDYNGVHVPQNPSDHYSLAYDKLVVPLVKAVQELSKQNDDLKKDNNELRKDFAEMKARINQLYDVRMQSHPSSSSHTTSMIVKNKNNAPEITTSTIK